MKKILIMLAFISLIVISTLSADVDYDDEDYEKRFLPKKVFLMYTFGVDYLRARLDFLSKVGEESNSYLWHTFSVREDVMSISLDEDILFPGCSSHAQPRDSYILYECRLSSFDVEIWSGSKEHIVEVLFSEQELIDDEGKILYQPQARALRLGIEKSGYKNGKAKLQLIEQTDEQGFRALVEVKSDREENTI